LALAPRQIDEVSDVLLRPKIAKKYAISAADRKAFLELLRKEALLLPDAQAPGVRLDPDDDYILGCAAAGGVDYLVTGDGDLLKIQRHQSVTIVSALEFLSMELE
jgi:putative PIN family toxin of toxin-antitoxin system